MSRRPVATQRSLSIAHKRRVSFECVDYRETYVNNQIKSIKLSFLDRTQSEQGVDTQNDVTDRCFHVMNYAKKPNFNFHKSKEEDFDEIRRFVPLSQAVLLKNSDLLAVGRVTASFFAVEIVLFNEQQNTIKAIYGVPIKGTNKSSTFLSLHHQQINSNNEGIKLKILTVASYQIVIEYLLTRGLIWFLVLLYTRVP